MGESLAKHPTIFWVDTLSLMWTMVARSGVSTTTFTPPVQITHTPTETITVMGRVQKRAVHLASTAWRWTFTRLMVPRIWQRLGTLGSTMMVVVTRVVVVLVWTSAVSST